MLCMFDVLDTLQDIDQCQTGRIRARPTLSLSVPYGELFIPRRFAMRAFDIYLRYAIVNLCGADTPPLDPLRRLFPSSYVALAPRLRGAFLLLDTHKPV